MIHSAPEVIRLASNFYEHFVKVPVPLVDQAHCLGPLLTDFLCEVCPNAIDPETDAFVANIYSTLAQKVFDDAKRQRKPDLH